MRHGTDGGVLVSNWANSLTAAVAALSTNGNQNYNWKLTVASHVQHSGFLVIPEHIVLDQEDGGYIEFANADAKIEFQSIGLSRRVLEIGEKFFKNCTVTGKDSNGRGGSTNIFWQNATKYPLRLRTALIDSTNLSHQFDVLDKAIGNKFVSLIATPNLISGQVTFTQKRYVYFDAGTTREYPQSWQGNAPFVADSDFTADMHPSAYIRINALATEATNETWTTVFSDLSGYVGGGTGVHPYQPKDIKYKNLNIWGNGRHNGMLVNGSPIYTGVYNGTSGAIYMGNVMRGEITNCFIHYPQSYIICIGRSGAYIEGLGGGKYAENIVCRDNRGTGLMSQGIAIINAKDCLIEGSRLEECIPYLEKNATMIDFEPNNPGDRCDRVEVRRNFISFAREGELNTFTGDPHPAQTVGGRSRIMEGIALNRSGADSCDGNAIIENTIEGGGGTAIGIRILDSTNTFCENNRLRGVYREQVYAKNNYRLMHRGNVFEGGGNLSHSVVQSVGNRESHFEDEYKLTTARIAKVEYGEFNLIFNAGPQGQNWGVYITTGGEMTLQYTSGQVFTQHMVGQSFRLNNGATFTVTSYSAINKLQTNYSGTAITNGKAEFLMSGNTYKSRSLTVKKATDSSSVIFKDVENLTPYVPVAGLNIGSATAETVNGVVYASETGRFSGGARPNGGTPTDRTFNFGSIVHPPSKAIMDTSRFLENGTFTENVTGLTANAEYRMRVFSAWDGGVYSFKVLANGSEKGIISVSNGIAGTVYYLEFSATASASGEILLGFTPTSGGVQALANAADWMPVS